MGVNMINADNCFNFAKGTTTVKPEVKRTDRALDDVSSGSGDRESRRHDDRLSKRLGIGQTDITPRQSECLSAILYSAHVTQVSEALVPRHSIPLRHEASHTEVLNSATTLPRNKN